jgi:uncharacterized repeat protein (TIGR03943 family)
VLPAKGLTATTALKRFNSGSQSVTIRKEVKEPKQEVATTTDTQIQVNKTPQGLVTSEVKKPVLKKSGNETDSTSKQKTEVKTKTSPFIVMPRSDDPGDIFSNFVFNLDSTDSLSSFKDAEVELVGFVLIDPTDATSKYHVSRFFIACCTADASPIGIPFEYSGSEYKNDDWVKVKGKLKIIKQDDFEKVLIVPSSIEKVAEPEFPYAYY